MSFDVRVLEGLSFDRKRQRNMPTHCDTCGVLANGRPWCLKHSPYAQKVAALVDAGECERDLGVLPPELRRTCRVLGCNESPPDSRYDYCEAHSRKNEKTRLKVTALRPPPELPPPAQLELAPEARRCAAEGCRAPVRLPGGRRRGRPPKFCLEHSGPQVRKRPCDWVGCQTQVDVRSRSPLCLEHRAARAALTGLAAKERRQRGPEAVQAPAGGGRGLQPVPERGGPLRGQPAADARRDVPSEGSPLSDVRPPAIRPVRDHVRPAGEDHRAAPPAAPAPAPAAPAPAESVVRSGEERRPVVTPELNSPKARRRRADAAARRRVLVGERPNAGPVRWMPALPEARPLFLLRRTP